MTSCYRILMSWVISKLLSSATEVWGVVGWSAEYSMAPWKTPAKIRAKNKTSDLILVTKQLSLRYNLKNCR